MWWCFVITVVSVVLSLRGVSEGGPGPPIKNILNFDICVFANSKIIKFIVNTFAYTVEKEKETQGNQNRQIDHRCLIN